MSTAIGSPFHDRQTVLFVDADPDTLDTYSAVASAEGLGVELANDGREALALASLVRPDVIVLELVDQSGLEALNALHESSLTRDIPIIAITNPRHEHLDEAASQCAAHLAKPFDLNDLLRLLGILEIGGSARSGSFHRS